LKPTSGCGQGGGEKAPDFQRQSLGVSATDSNRRVRPYARWCGRGRRVTAAPMTIWSATRTNAREVCHGLGLTVHRIDAPHGVDDGQEHRSESQATAITLQGAEFSRGRRFGSKLQPRFWIGLEVVGGRERPITQSGNDYGSRSLPEMFLAGPPLGNGVLVVGQSKAAKERVLQYRTNFARARH
jgi:hypothetical protein